MSQYPAERAYFFWRFSDERRQARSERGALGRDSFNQNLRKFLSKTQWIGSVQPEKFRKNWSTFRGGPLFPVGPVGILVERIAPLVTVRDGGRRKNSIFPRIPSSRVSRAPRTLCFFVCQKNTKTIACSAG